MAGFPATEIGLVISYSYLWKDKEERGLVKGRKDRPCAIVLTVEVPAAESNRRKQVAVAQIPPPRSEDTGVRRGPALMTSAGGGIRRYGTFRN